MRSNPPIRPKNVNPALKMIFYLPYFSYMQIKAVGTQMCVDSMGHKNGNGAMEYGHCHRMGGNQLFRLNSANQLAQYDQCVTTIRGKVTLTHCDTTQYKEWKHVSYTYIK